MSYLDWHVGMKVVCIKDTPWKCQNPWVLEAEPRRLPHHNEICVIAKFYPDVDGLYIILEGFDPFDTFNVRHFRPVEPRQTDISIFTAMLDPSRVTALWHALSEGARMNALDARAIPYQGQFVTQFRRFHKAQYETVEDNGEPTLFPSASEAECAAWRALAASGHLDRFDAPGWLHAFGPCARIG